jgi:hypothetical protein
MVCLLDDSVELAASLGAQQRRTEENDERQRDVELMRCGTVQAEAPS